MKVNRTTVISYLKKGSKIWDWCSYNPKEEIRKNGCNCSSNNCKQVEIFKDEISSGVFPSCIELDRKSIQMFGVKLNSHNISAVCTDKRKHHRGFTFKYINEIEQAI